MENFTGELAALGGALAFSFTSTCFTLAGRKLGASTTLALSMPISSVMLMIVHWITLGEFIPMSASIDRWLYLGSSSVISFVIGAIFLLRAFQYIGPRLSLLIGSLAPILSAILAWIFLNQALPPNSIFGIVLVVFGIIWVVSDGGKQTVIDINPNYRKGLLFALIAALGQAISTILSSQGVAGDFPAMSGGLIRAMVASITLWGMFAVQGHLGRNLRVIQTEPRSMLFILIASVTGPVIGASLVLLSLQFTSVGVSATLTAMSPIMLIPIGYFVFKERITLHAVAGTIVAIIGVAILFT